MSLHWRVKDEQHIPHSQDPGEMKWVQNPALVEGLLKAPQAYSWGAYVPGRKTNQAGLHRH